MTIEVKQKMTFDDLMDNCWSGAIETLKSIENAGLEDVLMDNLSQIYCDRIPDMTEVNDLLWFEMDDFILENKSLNEVDSLEELQDYMTSFEAGKTINDAIQLNKAEDLWEYLQDNYEDSLLSEVQDELDSLSSEDYIKFDNIKSLDELAKFAKEDKQISVLDVLDEVAEADRTEDFWNRLKKEYKGIDYYLINIYEEIECFDIDEL